MVKHFAFKLRFSLEKIDEIDLEVEFCPTENMTQDVLTNVVGRVKLRRFSKEIAGGIAT